MCESKHMVECPAVPHDWTQDLAKTPPSTPSAPTPVVPPPVKPSAADSSGASFALNKANQELNRRGGGGGGFD